jgi:hypothetical protein
LRAINVTTNNGSRAPLFPDRGEHIMNGHDAAISASDREKESKERNEPCSKMNVLTEEAAPDKNRGN